MIRFSCVLAWDSLNLSIPLFAIGVSTRPGKPGTRTSHELRICLALLALVNDYMYLTRKGFQNSRRNSSVVIKTCISSPSNFNIMTDSLKTYYHNKANGSRIFVEECGSGPLMVLMHGLGGTTNAFQPLISHLSSHFTMLRFDFPGSGFSTFKTAPSIPQFVSDLSSILEARETKEAPILVGHSLGSIIAMHYASQHPEVQALVLIGAGRSASHIPAVVQRMSGLASTARKGIEGIRDSTIANNVAASSSDLVRTIVRQMISSQDAEGYAATCEAACDKSHVDPDYAAIKCPVVIIAGDQDRISPLERSQELRGLIGGGHEKVLLEVVHSGHQQVLEDTDGVVRAMKLVFSLF